MARIKQLPPHEAHKIAAGEVVERPANVVKELVENALDAGATAITIYLEDAGKKVIRIVDNGHGMDHEDAKLCFHNHATSKISSVDDLQHIATFGFRGEALSSIAAVSHITLTTKESTAKEGIALTLNEGRITKETFASSNPGTDIKVEDLFFNVPARKKFLRSSETEWRQIVTLFQALCLDYLSISFKLFNEQELVHHCPATDNITARIAQLWDHGFANAMLPINAEKNNIRLSGAISHQHYARYDRNQIFLFINKRWIKNQHLSRALLRGYLNVLPPARYPAAFLFFELPPHEIDINIHPRKEEVQFLHPRMIETLLQETVKKTLEENLAKKIKPQENVPTFNFDRPAFDEPLFSAPPPTTTYTFNNAPPFATLSAPAEQQKKMSGDFATHSTQTNIHHEANVVASESAGPYQILGQLHQTYLLVEHEEGLFLVDQHAAHERILYEQFKERFNTVATTQLLFPQIITLNKDDIAVLTPHLPLIAQQGIGIELFGDQQLIIQSTPIPLKDASFDEFLRTVVGWVHEYRHVDVAEFGKLITEKLHAQMACKAAIKAGDVLSTTAMEELLKNLQKTTNRFSCPHGRPTGWLITTHEIEKKFKRKL